MRTLSLLLAAAMAAGCAAPGTPTPAGTDEPAPEQPAGPTVLHLESCIQFHTTFAARAQDFPLPDGFRPQADAAGMVALRVTPTVCANGTAMAVAVPVVAPADLALAQHAHEYVVELYADNATTAWLAQGGIQARECSCHLDFYTQAGPVFHAMAQDHEYTMRLALAPRDGPFHVGPVAYFVQDPPVRFVAGAGNATNLGVGAVALAYTGPGGAPPVFPGYLAHGVRELSTVWEVR